MISSSRLIIALLAASVSLGLFANESKKEEFQMMLGSGTGPSLIKQSEHKYLTIIEDEIGSEYSKYDDLIQQLAALTSQDTVEFRMHSYGGSVVVGAMIVNGILTTKAHTIAHVVAPTFSMGAWISCACNEVKMEPFSFLMFHNGSTSGQGKFSDIRTQIEQFTRLQDKFYGQCVINHLLTAAEAEQNKQGHDIYKFANEVPVK